VLIVRAVLRLRIRKMDLCGWREAQEAFGVPMHAGNAREDKWHHHPRR
jgi:hypothetical protein